MQTTTETPKTKNDLTTKGGALPAAYVPTETDPEILAGDIVIPSIYLMQGLSDLVQDRKAQIGDIVRSTTAEKLGDDKHPLRFIPLKLTNTWTISEKIGEKYEWRGVKPRNAANENDPYEFVDKGTDWKRVKTINLFALLTKDVTDFLEQVKTGNIDMNKPLLPVNISFRSTSFKAGRDVATFYTNIRNAKRFKADLAAHQHDLELSCFPDENDKGKYMVFKIGASSKISKEVQTFADEWFAIVNTAKSLKVDMAEAAESENGQTVEVDLTSESKF